jgi:WhiB family redox-sensing transcriptional regulator
VILPDFFGEGQPLCAETDPEAFFPPPGGTRESKQAKEVCGRCELLVPCRDWALAQETDLEGTWGGLTQHDRDKLRVA